MIVKREIYFIWTCVHAHTCYVFYVCLCMYNLLSVNFFLFTVDTFFDGRFYFLEQP